MRKEIPDESGTDYEQPAAPPFEVGHTSEWAVAGTGSGLFESIAVAFTQTAFELPESLENLNEAINQWDPYAPGLARWSTQYQSKTSECDLL